MEFLQDSLNNNSPLVIPKLTDAGVDGQNTLIYTGLSEESVPKNHIPTFQEKLVKMKNVSMILVLKMLIPSKDIMTSLVYLNLKNKSN